MDDGDCRTFDPDMQGFAVRVACIVATLSTAVLIFWNDEDNSHAVYFLLVQVYSALLATFFSLGRSQLTQNDAQFAITSTFSPLVVYLIYSAGRDLLNRPNGLFNRMRENRRIVCFLLSFLLVLWLALTVTIDIVTTAFRNPHCGEFSAFLIIASIVWWTLGPYLYTRALPYSTFVLLVFAQWLVYVLRHFRDIRLERCRRRSSALSRQACPRWHRRVAQQLHVHIHPIWSVVVESHPWVRSTLFVYAYLNWAVKVLFANNEFGDPNALSYGQLLALTVALSPFISACKLVIECRWGLWHSLRSFPRTFVRGCNFILTGRDNPWPRIARQKYHSPSVSIPLPVASEASMPFTDKNCPSLADPAIPSPCLSLKSPSSCSLACEQLTLPRLASRPSIPSRSSTLSSRTTYKEDLSPGPSPPNHSPPRTRSVITDPSMQLTYASALEVNGTIGVGLGDGRLVDEVGQRRPRRTTF
ncbi:hypothetical protein HGRIS_005601 [Hohenbuehelia grisea]|uniref:Uncharacterized protein n=1 Tax=Hohenbuehelia grisea TaxID=104357 RepID=A0ABR3JY79_9AGAR